MHTFCYVSGGRMSGFNPHGHLSRKMQYVELIFDVCVVGSILCRIFDDRIRYWRHVLQSAGMT